MVESGRLPTEDKSGTRFSTKSGSRPSERLGIAPSDSNVLYVGTGEQTRGNGVYRSTDAGATWKNVGLQDVPFIQAIIVDPRNPDVAVVGGNSIGFGMLWRPLPATAKTANRGIFRTVDGGKIWTKVFSAEDSIGVVDLCSDPGDAGTLYAVLYRPASGSGDSAMEATSDIVKSGDGGATWTPLASTGLPEKARGRVGIAVAPGTGGRRLYAILEQGFFRSDDGGNTWQQSTKDPRVTGNEYFSRVFADTRNPDLLYVSQTSMYRSTDGGKTFEAFAGAPSGDDFHVAWIDPRDPARMIFGVDQERSSLWTPARLGAPGTTNLRASSTTSLPTACSPIASMPHSRTVVRPACSVAATMARSFCRIGFPRGLRVRIHNSRPGASQPRL